MKTDMHVSADWANHVVAWMKRSKMKTRSFLGQLSLAPDDLTFGQEILCRQFAAILDHGAQASGDRSFGLHRGGDFEIKSGGILAYLTSSAATVGDAMQNYRRYAAVVSDGFKLDIESHRDGIDLHLHVSDPMWKSCRHLGEFTAARMVSGLRRITGVDLNPLHVQFMYPRAESAGECRRFFRCPVEYGAAQDTIGLSNEVLEIQIPGADSRLGYMLQSYADGLLQRARRMREETLQEKVTEIIRRRLSSGQVSLRDVAARLSMSERTLRRHLNETQVTFSELLDEVRRDLANQWLAGTTFDLKHISFLLGYSEPAAFSRAYKRWSGQSPGDARAA